MEFDARSLPAEVFRAPYLFFRLEDSMSVDLQSLLRGDMKLVTESRLEVFSPYTGQPRPCSLAEVEILIDLTEKVPTATSDLLRKPSVGHAVLRRMLDDGLLTDGSDQRWLGKMSVPWNSVANFFHTVMMNEVVGRSSTNVRDATPENVLAPVTRTTVREAQQDARAAFQEHIDRHGKPPGVATRYVGNGTDRVDLPVVPPDPGSFFELLSRRRTCRYFVDEPMEFEKLSSLLRWTFGVQGMVRLSADHHVALKTCPSGGSTHPVEAYPLVRKITGMEPGLYHYDAFAHALQPLEHFSEDTARALMVELAQNQEFAGDAAVLTMLVARVGRNFWKYRQSCRTYSVILQDAGHLSQTFYLAATELQLGAFYTGATSADAARDILGFDEARDALLGLCGCGLPDQSAENKLDYEPYTPRKSSHSAPLEMRQIVKSEAPGSSRSVAESPDSLASDGDFRKLRLSPPIEKG